MPAETRRRRKLYKASGRCRRGSLEKCLAPSFVARRRGCLEEAAEDSDVSWSLEALVGRRWRRETWSSTACAAEHRGLDSPAAPGRGLELGAGRDVVWQMPTRRDAVKRDLKGLG